MNTQPHASDTAFPLQRLASWGLKTMATLVLLGGLLGLAAYFLVSTTQWGRAPRLETPLAWHVWPGLFALVTLAWALLMWRRARELSRVMTPDFPAWRCVAACFRLAGEMAAVLSVLLGAAMAVLTVDTAAYWLPHVLDQLGVASDQLPSELAPVTALFTVGACVGWLLLGLLAGAGALFGGYLLAEALLGLLHFMGDIRRIRERIAGGPE